MAISNKHRELREKYQNKNTWKYVTGEIKIDKDRPRINTNSLLERRMKEINAKMEQAK